MNLISPSKLRYFANNFFRLSICAISRSINLDISLHQGERTLLTLNKISGANMSILTQVSIPDAFIIFFLTLGPLKAIGPFAQATRGADPIMRQTLAWRATIIATVIVLVVALVGAVILKNWRVSVPAVMIAGSLILFLPGLSNDHEPTRRPAHASPRQTPKQPPPSLALAHFPLAIPALVTAPGITAIVAFMAIAGNDWTQKSLVITLLLVIMALNLLALLNVGLIFHYVSPTVLLVVGWVMAVLQAALAAQYLLMPWCVSGPSCFGLLRSKEQNSMDNAQPATTTDVATELARERTRQAADRTLMAWIRTSLSLIGFGFGIAKYRDILLAGRVYQTPPGRI